MNIFHAKFSTGQVTAAAGVSNAVLQSWLKRGVILGQNREAEIEGGGSPGIHRRFSFFNVMEIAIAKALIDGGLTDLANAFAAGRYFAHVGAGEIGNTPLRLPSMPYNSAGESGMTLLCVSGDKAKTVYYRPSQDVIPNVVYSLSQDFSFFTLGIDPIFDRVTVNLGYHPEDVLALAYNLKA